MVLYFKLFGYELKEWIFFLKDGLKVSLLLKDNVKEFEEIVDGNVWEWSFLIVVL